MPGAWIYMTKFRQSRQSASYWNVWNGNSMEMLKQDLPPVQTSQILKIIWVVAETVEIFICLLLMHVYQLNSSFRSFNWTMNICILIILSCPRTKTVVECMCWHLLFTCLQLFPRILSFTSLAVISIWWSILWLLSTYVIQKKTLSDQLK